MVRTIERRVSALEEATGGGGESPECGGPDGPDDHTTYELVFVDFVQEAEEEWCETCGRQTGIVIRWPEDLP